MISYTAAPRTASSVSNPWTAVPVVLPDHDISDVRQIWWHHRRLGLRYPAEIGVIVIDGGWP